ncbi:hypothetical protein SLEP1_g37579 [Rubroshorea leprosula]|uniref:Uncharacterized protein n=1 Tax=Rubroshorea leprosula TaxID=152421 RepID=A0AAV5KV27_9ROSI|nr:hypothetical protein SLEP1_g37579 [Rubroshorea leprosula]
MSQKSEVVEHQISVEDEWNFSKEEERNLRTLEEDLPDMTKPKIRRVTHILRNNESLKRFFEPNFVAIGPLHHSKHPDSRLYKAEKAKLKLAAMFVEGSGTTKEALYHKIKEELTSLKACYGSKEIETWNDYQLAFIFLVDGCALLRFIDCAANDKLTDLVFKTDLLTFAKLDLFLLENQLPYQLLQLLISSCSSTRVKELNKSIEDFISKNVVSLAGRQKQEQNTTEAQESQQQNPASADFQQPQEQQPAHLLALLREKMIFEVKSAERPAETFQRFLEAYIFRERKPRHYGHSFRNIKELKERGIRLRMSKTSSIKDVSFSRAILNFCFASLNVPPITVDDSTGPKFMNLIAFEMSYDFENKFEVTSYISFLDYLIDREEDVRELSDSGVLQNELGSDKDVADLFNTISKNLVPDPEAYSEVKLAIQEHCNCALATYVVQLYYTYFSSPWSFLAFVGAILGLFFQAIQSYYKVYGKESATN